MIRDAIIYFIVLIAVQALILNNIYLFHFVTPIIYIYFILKLPFDTPAWLQLLSAFAMGAVLDIFTATPGLQASVCVFTAFVRPFIIRALRSGREYEPGLVPGFRDNGSRWFLIYSIILIAIHIAGLTLLENFGSSSDLQIFYRWLFNTLTSFFLITILEVLNSSGKKKQRI